LPRPSQPSQLIKAGWPDSTIDGERYVNYMIKGEDGYPVKEWEIEVELRDRMVSYIQSSIVRNLEAIKKFLLQTPGYEDICAGIYTYAVEEYGKALYLKGLSSPSSDSSSSSNNNTINLQYKGAFLHHPTKFRQALDVLPDTCKRLYEGGSSTSTSFSFGSFTTDLIANFEARKRIFFVDFTQDKKSIEMPPKVDRDLLLKAVDDFLDFMKNQVFL
jgi:hypothetical protein